MNKYFLTFSLLTFLYLSSLAVKAEELILTDEMVDTLNDYNVSFKVWESKDYSHTIQNSAKAKNRQPFYLSLDVNEDSKPDLILDGRDDKHNILVCLISGPKAYKVEVLRVSELVEPAKHEVWNDGAKEKGLNYYLWPSNDGSGFTLAYPQQSDANGDLLIDGEMVEYIFSQGVFSESYQII